ncbi:MAG: DUF433 domain-containing protein [Hyphomicrobium sp.]
MAHERITADPKVMMGKPVIKGTRIKVELLLRLLGNGHTLEELMDGYQIERDDILAALTYVADFVPGAGPGIDDGWNEGWIEISGKDGDCIRREC